jgi:hypothetical protein
MHRDAEDARAPSAAESVVDHQLDHLRKKPQEHIQENLPEKFRRPNPCREEAIER